MRSGRIEKYIILLMLVAFAFSFLINIAMAKKKVNDYKNLSKGRTLGIGAPLPFPLGPYLVYWFGDTYGITGSGVLFGNVLQLSTSLLYKFSDKPWLDYLLYGSLNYLKVGEAFTGLGLVIGAGLEYSVFRFLASTVNAGIYLGLTPEIGFVPTISASVVFYLMM